MRRVLVAGARHGSLGAICARMCRDHAYSVTTVGLTDEDHILNLTDYDGVHVWLREQEPFHHVICTVGINEPGGLVGQGWLGTQMRHMHTNYLGPLCLMSSWSRKWRNVWRQETEPRPGMEHAYNFVAVSSNSANIARSNSGAYCASKAALTMGVRCAARELATYPLSAWVVEPGWLEGTPMSENVRARLVHQGVALHRIPGGKAISPVVVADVMVRGLSTGRALNGCTLRIDGGEQ